MTGRGVMFAAAEFSELNNFEFSLDNISDQDLISIPKCLPHLQTIVIYGDYSI